MTVDEILASGRYTDRRGREWERRIRWSTSSGLGMWSHAYRLEPLLGGPVYRLLDADQMRLLIERDKHRGECPGLGECISHPVPKVFVLPKHRGADYAVIPVGKYFGMLHHLWGEAMDAARRLAVSNV